jgi:DNA-binding protein H-NS
MPTLKSLRKQIEQLQQEEQRLVQAAMAGSVAKVKKLMNALGVKLEHLGESMTSAPAKQAKAKAAPKKTRAKRAGVGTPKYQDPATGATWSGFGRAPVWIAGAANREEFLVGASKAAPAKKSTKAAKAAPAKKAVKVAKAAEPATRTRKRAAKKAAPVKKAATPTAKKVPLKKTPRASQSAEAAAPASAD